MNQPPSLHARLWKAIDAGNLAQLCQALSEGANPDSGAGGWTPLGKTLRTNQPALALALLEAGAKAEGKEQQTDLVELAAIPGLEEVLVALLKRGAKATAQSLRVAARWQNVHATSILLSCGADPNDTVLDEFRNIMPAICCWPKKTPPPDDLIEASLSPSPNLAAARLIAQYCATNQHTSLMQKMAQGRFPKEAWHNFLVHALYSHWSQGVNFALENKLVPTKRQDPSQSSILVTIGHAVRNNRVKGPALAMMDKMIDYGFSPNDYGWTLARGNGGGQPEWVDAPLLLELIRYSDDTGRWRYLNKLLQKGALLECRYPDTGGQESFCGVAHLLIHKEDYTTLRKLLKTAPSSNWEQGSYPGLISTLLENNLNDKAIDAIRHLLLNGADPNRINAKGRTPLDVLVDALDTTILKTQKEGHGSIEVVAMFGRLLIENGADPYLSSQNGDTVIDRLRGLGGGYYEGMVSDWISSRLLLKTPNSPSTPKNSRRRL